MKTLTKNLYYLTTSGKKILIAEDILEFTSVDNKLYYTQREAWEGYVNSINRQGLEFNSHFCENEPCPHNIIINPCNFIVEKILEK